MLAVESMGNSRVFKSIVFNCRPANKNKFYAIIQEKTMSILQAQQLGISYGAFDLFKGISLTIANDAKIGLIGPNGVGKSTIMMILAGLRIPTTGQVSMAKNRKIGYLRQEAVEAFGDCENSVYHEMLAVFEHLHQRQAQLHELEIQMADSNGNLDALLAEYGRLQEAFELTGGYDFEVRIQQTLEGLGLGKDAWHMPLNHLSGGQKTRALLARLLLEKPDLLMLDEPTNHLDLDAVEWLENTLNNWPGAVLIVSHDRYFLDNVVNTIWEMSPAGIESYSGTYSNYLLQRQERWEYQERVFKEEKARLLKDVDFIQRNWVRASTHARALGLLKKVSRELAIIEQFGLMSLRSGKKWSEYGLRADRPLEVIEAIRGVNAINIPTNRPPKIRPQFRHFNNSGNYVLRVQEAEIGYPGNSLFTARDVELKRGDCAVLMGPNGSGKTTFLKVLLGELEPLRGEVQPGAGLQVGYFAQAQEQLKGTHSVLEEFQRHKDMDEESARRHLAAYLFRGEDVFKPIDGLSGGERARLVMALLALEGANFLVLDEPTNHLDIPAREALQEVLEEYNGTILLVSHDRYLINRLATRVWEIKDKQLITFNGNYREYILRQTTMRYGNQNGSRKILLTQAPMARDNSKQTRQRSLDLEKLEGRIREKEKEIQQLSHELQKTGISAAFEKMHQLSNQLAHAEAIMEELMQEWEQLVAQ
jgi:ATP-binding cassette subfamily F protein 3